MDKKRVGQKVKLARVFYEQKTGRRKQKKRGVTDSKKGGNGQQDFLKTLVNTGFLAPLQTLIYLIYLIYLSSAHRPHTSGAVCYHKEESLF